MHSEDLLSEQRMNEFGIVHPALSNTKLLNIYRDIRNKLLNKSDFKNFVCLVTTVSEKRESSLLSINLGAVFAFDKARSSIVIDCDTDKNLLDELTVNDNNTGLIEFIETEHEDVTTLLHDSGIERLRIVPSGDLSETRTETLESHRMRQIVLELSSRYPDRYIFINAPNTNLSSDVQILANICDMVVLELKLNTVVEAEIAKALDMFDEEKLVGIVLTES